MKLSIILFFILLSSISFAKTNKQKLKEALEEREQLCYEIKFYNKKLCGQDECDRPLPPECRKCKCECKEK